MVWLHGGAFSFGSANSAWYDGSSLARRNDIVVVSVNHRLNIFGHLDLSGSGDERFAQSGNAGVLDLVAALGWVREHAARFGGDPGNVTIFGQSGGGGKVSALLGMPGAQGLFHKAIIQSGAGVRFAERERTARLAEAVLKRLEIGPNPETTRRPAGAADRAPDGSHRPGAEDPAAAAPCVPRPLQFRTGDRRAGAAGPSLRSGRVGLVGRHPVLIGGTKSEFAIYLAPDDAVWNRTLSEEEMRKRIAAVAGDAADGLVAYYKRRDPAATPSDLLIAALTAANFQVRSTLLAERKVARAKAPVWMYRFDWETPAFGGRLKSPHSMDVPFVFNTLDVIVEPHRKPGRAGSRRPGVDDLGELCAQRRSSQQIDPGVARLYRRQARHDAVQRSVPGRRRPGWRGPAALEQDRDQLMKGPQPPRGLGSRQARSKGSRQACGATSWWIDFGPHEPGG